MSIMEQQMQEQIEGALRHQEEAFEDVFLNTLLKTLNCVYHKFKFIKNKNSIYIIGYEKSSFECKIPKEGGDVDIIYPEKDIVIIDKNCVTPLSKKYLKSTYSWKSDYKNKDCLLGFSAGCKIFGDIVKSKRENNAQ